MSIHKSTNQLLSRFNYGGTSEYQGDMLGWWERVVFEKSPTDVSLPIDAKYHKRPELLAYDLYGKSSLMWFILQYNDISDISEFTEGTILTLPTKNRVFNEILTKARL